MASKLGLISQSYVILGEAPLSDLEDGTRPALIASNLYDTIYESALSIEQWHFASIESELSRITGETNNKYAYAFQLPSDYLSVITVNDGRGSNNFDIYGDKLYADAEEISLLYISKVDEALLPPWFAQYVIYSLAKGFSIPLTDSTSRLEGFIKLERDALAEARYINSTQAPIDGFYTLDDLGHSTGRRSPTRS